ncbi:MAG: hypothetical protein AAGD01_05805 [Acidobacteriota bacterium]
MADTASENIDLNFVCWKIARVEGVGGESASLFYGGIGLNRGQRGVLSSELLDVQQGLSFPGRFEELMGGWLKEE